MGAGLSIQVMDVTRGQPASGLLVEVYALDEGRRRIGGGVLGPRGTLEDPRLDGIGRGVYEVVFHVAAFYRRLGHELPDPPFLDVVPLRVGVADAGSHYHLPLKITPWGLSLFRGG
jgi:5-hydroxyisourate hydrolase